MNVLITGGAGFIGSHLAEKLIEKGDRVYVVDSLYTGRLENVEHLRDNPSFCLIIDSILNEQLMADVIKKCDIIYHLAAAVGVKYIMENRLKTIQMNIRGSEIVLELASKEKKKVMLASSSEIYGKNGKVPYSEDDDRVLGSTTFHRWSYSCAKALSEFLAFAYWHEQQLPIVIMRLFNTIGPRQVGQYGMVVPRFIESALSGTPLTVYGDGTQTRCFAYISDVVRAMLALGECPDAVGNVFNVGNNEEISIETLARKILQLVDSDSAIEYIPYKEAYGEGFEDMKRRVPDIRKIYKFVGWKPSVGIDRALMEMIAVAQEELSLKRKMEREAWNPKREEQHDNQRISYETTGAHFWRTSG